jgi:hypothetical protein
MPLKKTKSEVKNDGITPTKENTTIKRLENKVTTVDNNFENRRNIIEQK